MLPIFGRHEYFANCILHIVNWFKPVISIGFFYYVNNLFNSKSFYLT